MFKQEVIEQALSDVAADATDQQVAALIAEYLITRGPAPFRLVIDHDARKAPCPVPIHFQLKNLSGAQFADENTARVWIVAAALLGFRVSRMIGRAGASGRGTIANVRQDAERRRELRAHPLDDDEIPF